MLDKHLIKFLKLIFSGNADFVVRLESGYPVWSYHHFQDLIGHSGSISTICLSNFLSFVATALFCIHS